VSKRHESTGSLLEWYCLLVDPFLYGENPAGPGRDGVEIRGFWRRGETLVGELC
jgi:hypothetical protein